MVGHVRFVYEDICFIKKKKKKNNVDCVDWWITVQCFIDKSSFARHLIDLSLYVGHKMLIALIGGFPCNVLSINHHLPGI